MPLSGRRVYFITHPDVVIDPAVPVPDWPLSEHGRQRMSRMLSLPWVASVGSVWSSTERKALDGAVILGLHLGLEHRCLHELGENDRSATGFLPREEFEATANEFFAHPNASVRGWERAVDAQRRIIAAVTKLIEIDTNPLSVAIVSHGGVGALLLAHLLGQTISRAADQPPGAGGHYFCFDAVAWHLHHGWRPIDPP